MTDPRPPRPDAADMKEITKPIRQAMFRWMADWLDRNVEPGAQIWPEDIARIHHLQVNSVIVALGMCHAAGLVTPVFTDDGGQVVLFRSEKRFRGEEGEIMAQGLVLPPSPFKGIKK